MKSVTPGRFRTTAEYSVYFVKDSKLYTNFSAYEFYSFLLGECKTRGLLLQVPFHSLSDPITLRVELQIIKQLFLKKKGKEKGIQPSKNSSRKPVHFLQKREKTAD